MSYYAGCSAYNPEDDYDNATSYGVGRSYTNDYGTQPNSGYSAAYSTREYAPQGLSRYHERPSSSARDRAGARYAETRYADTENFSRSSNRPDDGARRRAAGRHAYRSYGNETSYTAYGAYQERQPSPSRFERPDDVFAERSDRSGRHYVPSAAGPVDPFEASLRAARHGQFWESGNDGTAYRRNGNDRVYNYSIPSSRPSYTQGDDDRYMPDSSRITGRYGSFAGPDYSGYDYGQSTGYGHGQPSGYGDYAATYFDRSRGMDRLAREAAARRARHY